MAMKRTETVWTVINRKHGYWVYGTEFLKRDAIAKFVVPEYGWDYWRKKGWRCVKAKITYEVKP